jgi:pimeloyl-ACP methyl ester carboxylesterase
VKGTVVGCGGWVRIAAVTLACLGVPTVSSLAAPWPGADATKCTVDALTALEVHKMTVASATDVPAAGQLPAFCDVKGSVETEGNSAGFEIRLPANWNGKFVFFGVGGLGGNTIPSASRTEVEGSLRDGYASAVTDTGHTAAPTDASWALISPGVPNTPKLLDYYYRAAHEVAVAAKQLVMAFFSAKEIKRAYFDGCSNGGRMALMEAERYPDDYDGIVAGAPFMNAAAIFPTVMRDGHLSSSNFIPGSALDAVDQAVNASCDASDGARDGLIQNPAMCAFNTKSLVCKGDSTATCLTQPQADSLQPYFRAVRDSHGNLLYPGWSVSDLSGRAGAAFWTFGREKPDFDRADLWTTNAPLGWLFAQNIIRYMVELDPKYNVRTFDVNTDGVVGDAALKLFNERMELLAVGDPAKLQAFRDKGKKLLMYHGFSDPALSPFRTIELYEQLATATSGSYPNLQKSVRLFMVPGMQHCGGGPGPNSFVMLPALDKWVDAGAAPEQILATKYLNDDPSQGVARTMPLCKFPQQAKYKGAGDVNDAASWFCADQPSLLSVGLNGVEAGLKEK